MSNLVLKLNNDKQEKNCCRRLNFKGEISKNFDVFFASPQLTTVHRWIVTPPFQYVALVSGVYWYL